MGPPYELWIALRYLKTRRAQTFASLISWLSVGGVAVGVAALTTVVSVMTGFQETLRDKIIGAQAHAVVYPMGAVLHGAGELAEAVAAVEGVMSATPFALGQAMAAGAKGTHGAVIKGIDGGDPVVRRALEPLVVEGGFAGLVEGQAGALVGRELARTLGVGPGALVQVVAPRDGVPRLQALRVVGVFSAGMYDYDANLMLVSLATAQGLFGLGDGATGVEVRGSDPYAAPALARELESRLGPRYWVRDWTQQNRALFTSLKLQKAVLALILGLILLVAAFNVAAALIMVVLEKTRDIGILRAMGATRASIRRVFALEGLATGGLGAALGAALGLGLCAVLRRQTLFRLPSDVYFIDTLPVVVEPRVFAAVAAGAVALCYLAALYPAWRASGLDPVETIRDG
ncbi:MAG: FtsX-like permease family protein [Deferrisomatales bacterium]